MPDKCKHEKAVEGAQFCPECGEELSSDEDRFVNRVADAVFNRLHPKKKVNGDNDGETESLLDRVTGKKKKAKK